MDTDQLKLFRSRTHSEAIEEVAHELYVQKNMICKFEKKRQSHNRNRGYRVPTKILRF
jgi:hypothetical protein